MTEATAPEKHIVWTAIAAAMLSPCEKSKRGVVIYRRFDKIVQVGVGFDHPPNRLPCTGSGFCRESCSQRCVHAEAAALRDAHGPGRSAGPFDLVHVKAIGHKLVPSGGPSCWQCARDLLEDGRVEHVWLFLETGWRRYTMVEFYNETMRACGLPEANT